MYIKAIKIKERKTEKRKDKTEKTKGKMLLRTLNGPAQWLVLQAVLVISVAGGGI